MARQDIAGLLTGISSTQQPVQQAVPGSPNFYGEFMAARGRGLQQGLGGLLRGGEPSTQERIQGAVAKLDLNSPDDLNKLAKVLQARGDLAGAAQAIAKAKEVEKQRLDELDQEEAQTGFLQFIATNYPQYTGLVQTGVLKPENWTSFIKNKAEKGNLGFGGADQYVDTQGNLYYGAMIKDPEKGIRAEITPLPGSPEKPDGQLSMVASGNYAGFTSEQIQTAKVQLAQQKEDISVKGAQQKEQNKLFAQKQGSAPDEYSLAATSVKNADDMLLILDQITTGGLTATGSKALTDTFNLTDTNIGEFDTMAKQMMVDKLNAFGSNPSDGERRAAAELVPQIEKSTRLNRRIIERFKEEMSRRARNREYLMTPQATSENYNDFTIGQYGKFLDSSDKPKPKTWDELTTGTEEK